MHFPILTRVKNIIKTKITHFSDKLLEKTIKLFQLTEQDPKKTLIAIGATGGCMLLTCGYSMINYFSMLNVALSALTLYSFYNVVKIYLMRELASLEGISTCLHYAAIENSHVASINKIKSIFSNKWLSRSEKNKMLMKYENLHMLAQSQSNYSPECIDERDTFFISLIQQYLSSEQINTLLSMRGPCLEDNRLSNIFGLLVKYRNTALIKKLLELPGVDSNQKYNTLMLAQDDGSSALSIASASVHLTALQEGVNGEIVTLGLTEAQMQAYSMVVLLIEASETLFTHEQKLALLFEPDAAGNRPLRNLQQIGADRLIDRLIHSCTDEIKLAGAALYQVGIQKNVPRCLLNAFIDFAADTHHPRASVEIRETGLEKAKQLYLNRQ